MKLITVILIVLIAGFAGFAIGRGFGNRPQGQFTVDDIDPGPETRKPTSFADDLAAARREASQKQAKEPSTGPNTREPVTASITLGGMELRLGMPQAAVLDRLGADFTLLKTQTTDSSWIVKPKDGPTDQSIGSVQFTNGRLVLAQKDWLSDRKGVEFAIALHGVLSSLHADNLRTCELDVRHGQQPHAEFRSATLRCIDSGGRARNLELSVDKLRPYGQWAQIAERLY